RLSRFARRPLPPCPAPAVPTVPTVPTWFPIPMRSPHLHCPHRSLCRLLEPWARAAALALALVFAAAPAATAQPRRTPDAPGGAAIPPAARVTVHPRNVIAPPGYIARRTLPDSV